VRPHAKINGAFIKMDFGCAIFLRQKPACRQTSQPAANDGHIDVAMKVFMMDRHIQCFKLHWLSPVHGINNVVAGGARSALVPLQRLIKSLRRILTGCLHLFG
jgi:hypothetical protein